jgi:hypothetical protein
MAGPMRGMQKLTEEDVARAQGLMNSGLGAEAVRAKLIEGGMVPGIADHAIDVAVERRLAAESFEMLSNGQPPGAVKQFLVGKGVSPFVADEVIQDHLNRLHAMGRFGPGVIRRVFGVLFIVAGIVMLFNPIGFRFIGFILILIGLSMMGW